MDILPPLLGGILIGSGSLLALVVSGKIPGISGVIARSIRPQKGDLMWRLLFLAGIVVGSTVMLILSPGQHFSEIPSGRSLPVIAIAGLLVGFGTRLGGGCTSGHGVCGIGAGAKDAFIYTCTFMASGAATVWIWNQLG